MKVLQFVITICLSFLTPPWEVPPATISYVKVCLDWEEDLPRPHFWGGMEILEEVLQIFLDLAQIFLRSWEVLKTSQDVTGRQKVLSKYKK